MTKKTGILTLILFCITYISAQTSIIGKISDKNNQPINNAIITLKDQSDDTIAYTRSDNKSNFKIEITQTGHFILSVNALGYEIKKTEIFVLKFN